MCHALKSQGQAIALTNEEHDLKKKKISHIKSRRLKLVKGWYECRYEQQSPSLIAIVMVRMHHTVFEYFSPRTSIYIFDFIQPLARIFSEFHWGGNTATLHETHE